MINSPVVTALNASTYTAIVIPYTDLRKAVSYFTDDDTAFYEATDATGTDEALIPAGTKINVGDIKVKKADGILLYAKAVADTPNLNVLIGNP